MSELNRPETPGPWGGGRPGNDLTEQDIRAIADLPAWIEAHDEWKARAEKAEAATKALWGMAYRWANGGDPLPGNPEQAGESVVYLLGEYGFVYGPAE